MREGVGRIYNSRGRSRKKKGTGKRHGLRTNSLRRTVPVQVGQRQLLRYSCRQVERNGRYLRGGVRGGGVEVSKPLGFVSKCGSRGLNVISRTFWPAQVICGFSSLLGLTLGSGKFRERSILGSTLANTCRLYHLPALRSI